MKSICPPIHSSPCSTPALGMTAVIPDMDPTRPATVNPERIIEAVVQPRCHQHVRLTRLDEPGGPLRRGA